MNLKITLVNGKEFRIRNTFVNSIKEFISSNLMPHGTQLIWYEILKGQWIQVKNIVEISEDIIEEDVLEVEKISDREVQEE